MKFEEMIGKIEKCAKAYYWNNRVRFMKLRVECDDFVQDILFNTCKRKGKFDSKNFKLKQLEPYVYLCCYRYYCDLVRKANRKKNQGKNDTLSITKIIYDTIQSYDGTPPKRYEDALVDYADMGTMSSRLFEMIESLPSEGITKSVSYTWGQLLKDSITEDAKSISRQNNIPLKVVNNSLKELTYYLVNNK